MSENPTAYTPGTAPRVTQVGEGPAMRHLTRAQDPTGFLSLFRLAASDRFGDPSGHIQGRGKWHHGRKAGPGRKHESKAINRRRLEPARGPGSLGCEAEIRQLIHRGERKAAMALYERNEDVFFLEGFNFGLPRLKLWYSLAVRDDPRAA